jgi:hypothetical protein
MLFTRNIFKLMILALAFGGLNQAQAAGYCTLQSQLVIKSAHIILGGSSGYGKGDIICTGIDGGYTIPVVVRTKSFGVGLGASQAIAQMSSAGAGVFMDGTAMLGDYAMAKGSAQVISLGGEVGVSLTASRRGFSLPLELKMKSGNGLELAVNIGSMSITEDLTRARNFW